MLEHLVKKTAAEESCNSFYCFLLLFFVVVLLLLLFFVVVFCSAVYTKELKSRHQYLNVLKHNSEHNRAGVLALEHIIIGKEKKA